MILLSAIAVTAVAEDRLLIGTKDRPAPVAGDNRVRHRCLTPEASDRISLPLEREHPWSLPKTALAADFRDTINILVLRFDFQYEEPDDPNTTGLGRMDVTGDWESFFDSAGHFIDPPPHDSLYFDAHLRALRTYWEIVSDGRLTIQWDIYPSGANATYELPQPMSYYGSCDWEGVIAGLEDYFIDCIRLADTVTPEIDFGLYESIFLFHAGSDAQNDIGYPPTCHDLFSGFIKFGDSLAVDSGANFVRTALILPEMTNQDNRATALNGVIAHEFGHQLGLVDLYSTFSFLSQLGDFSLMDNNGFGSGIDFGFEVGSVFGAIPVYPMAWSRAFLGFVDVVDFRQGSDIRLVAAEMASEGIKVARIPITESEYYLLENRVVDIDGQPAAARLDSVSNVILGPTDLELNFNREYDFLLPGSGMLIFHVDELVASMDYDYDGRNNFDDNQLQWVYDIFGNPVDRFITLVEADGIVNFGGIYRAGFGSADDMFRDDRNDAFTPNTNPPAIDNSGNNTHIYVTNITRDVDPASDGSVLADSVILFDVEVDRLVDGFPVRAGYPGYTLSPIADDLDGDGNPEILVSSWDRLMVVTPDGQNFLIQYTGCDTCPIYVDTAYSFVNNGQGYPLPVFTQTSSVISTATVTGTFSDNPDRKFIALGRPVAGGATGMVELYTLQDDDADGLADLVDSVNIRYFSTVGEPVALSFGDILYAVTDIGRVYLKRSYAEVPELVVSIDDPTLTVHGTCRYDSALVMLIGDSSSTSLVWSAPGDQFTITIDDYYHLGPVLCDVNSDGRSEVVVATDDGKIALVTFDPAQGASGSGVMLEREFDFSFSVNPVVGDVDLDGQPDIIIGGTNAIYAFNHELTLKTSFPIEVNDRFPTDQFTDPPVVADIEHSGMSEIVFPTMVGNIYSFGPELSFGFPLSAGEFSSGSPVYLSDTAGGKLGYLGFDGWFYLWHVDEDNSGGFWPMWGADPAGTFTFDSDRLPAPKQYAEAFPQERFFNYPNPVVDGFTTIRYFLGQDASSVELNIYDLSGQRVENLSGPTSGLVDNELVWDCGRITPGVYRCVIDVNFGDFTETAFTDIAIIR